MARCQRGKTLQIRLGHEVIEDVDFHASSLHAGLACVISSSTRPLVSAHVIAGPRGYRAEPHVLPGSRTPPYPTQNGIRGQEAVTYSPRAFRILIRCSSTAPRR